MKLPTILALVVLALLAVLLTIRGEPPPKVETIDGPGASTISDVALQRLDHGGVAVRPPRVRLEQPILAASVMESAGTDVAETGDLSVYVVDAAGAPVGNMPLKVHQRSRQARLGPISASTVPGTGLAIFKGARDELMERDQFTPGSLFQVCLDIPGVDLACTDIDLAEWPDDAIYLTAPSCGSLEVRVEDAQGALIQTSNWILATPYFEGPSGLGRLERGERVGVWATDRLKATFPYVQAHTTVRLEVQQRGLFGSVEQQIEGLRVGEHRVVTLLIDGSLPYLTGRVVTRDGQAIDARYLKVMSGGVARSRVELDPDGSFTLPILRTRGGQSSPIRLRLLVQLRGPGGTHGGGATLVGDLSAEMPTTDGPVDVGNVVMTRAPVFASGRVVSDAGEPIEGAMISIYTKFNQRSDPEDFGWNATAVPYHYSGSNGYFEVAADLPAGEYAISASAKHYVNHGVVRFVAGQQNLLLPVSTERFISGRLLLPEGVNTNECKVVAKVIGATREETTYISFSSGVSSKGKFTVSGLRQPAVQLTLQYGEPATVLATMKNVAPSAEAVHTSRRLDPWDLTKELRALDLRVLSADGTPVTDGLVTYGGQSSFINAGRVRMLVRRSDDDEVTLVCPGHLRAVLSAEALPREIQLMRGIPVRVAIARPLPELPLGSSLTLSLERQGHDWLYSEEIQQHPRQGRDRWREKLTVELGATEWLFHVPVSGPYRPVWTLLYRKSPSSRGRTREVRLSNSDWRFNIVVEDQGRPTPRFLLDVDQEEARSALKNL